MGYDIKFKQKAIEYQRERSYLQRNL